MRRNRLSRIVWLATIVVVAAVGPAGRGAALEVWRRPVPGVVARPFRAPLTRYGAGHLGVDLAAAPGTSVRAAGAGIVVFAGVVAGTRHVVVAHPGGLRTSYSFLASIRVAAGEAVRRGQIVGTSGGWGPGHEGTVLHFGLRIGDTYVDPMRLFAAPDLAAVVHLAPDSGRADRVVPIGLRPNATDFPR